MKNKQHNPTTMIKSSFSNKIHKLMNKCYGIKPGTKEWYDCKRNHYDFTGKPKLTDQEKIELFDKIEEIYRESSIELTNYYGNRSYKKRIDKQRVERGWEPKKKTSKEEYEKMFGELNNIS